MTHPTPGDQPYPTSTATSAAFAAHVNPGKVAAYEALGLDLVMGERSGARFRDAFDGRWLYNCHSNGGVFNLGHRHPTVVAAVRDALGHLDIGNHHLVSGWRAVLAERLAAGTDARLPGVVFGVGGGEAIDLGLKLARAHTGRSGIVSAVGGYHGHTGLAMAAGDPAYRDPFGPNLPGFVQVPFNDLDALDRRADADDALAPYIDDERVRGFLLQNLRSGKDGFGWQANLDLLRSELATIAGMPEVSGTFERPVLWLAGEHSDYVHPDHAPRMRELFPTTRLVTVKGAGHWVHSEQPDAFVSALRVFLTAD